MATETPICDFGWQAPDVALKTPDGELYRLADYLGKAPVLVAFLCNHCPYVKRIARPLAEATAALREEGIETFGIMSNDYRDYPADAPDKMTAFAEENGWAFPYLVDEDQSVGRAFDAQCTPDFFGFDASGGLQYRGRLDELLPAMRLIAETGHGPAEQRPSMGCSIKWTRT